MKLFSPEPIDFRGSAFSDDLDMIRGIAALAVFFQHFSDLFYVKALPPGSHSIWFRVFRLAGGFGHDAVMVFFVLSGLLIGNSILRAHAANRWSWKDYLLNRFSRLYVVLIPALLLGALWDNLGMALPATSAVYRHGCADLYGFFQTYSVSQVLSVKVFLENLGFLQGIRSMPTFGSNTPLWSLSYEFWYYLIFPCLFLTVWGRQRWYGKAAFLIAGMVMLAFVGPFVRLSMLVWLMGAALNLRSLYPRVPGRRARVVLAAGGGVLFLGALAVERLQLVTRFFPRAGVEGFDGLIIGAAAAFFLYGLYQLRPSGTSGAYRSAAQFLARMSYTLYAVHLPLFLLLRFVLAPTVRWMPDGLHLAYGLPVGLLVFFYAFLVSRFTEAKTAQIRDRLRNLLHRHAPHHVSDLTQAA